MGARAGLDGRKVSLWKAVTTFFPYKFHFNIILPSHSYSKCVLKVFLPNLVMFSFPWPPNVAVQWAPISLVLFFETLFHGSGCIRRILNL